MNTKGNEKKMIGRKKKRGLGFSVGILQTRQTYKQRFSFLFFNKNRIDLYDFFVLFITMVFVFLFYWSGPLDKLFICLGGQTDGSDLEVGRV